MGNVIVCISIIFGGLSLISAVSQMRAEKNSMSAIIMITGSVVLISAAICNLVKRPFDYILALIGCTGICIAAIRNGLKGGNFHIQHHVIRIILSLLLVVGFFLL